MDRRVFLKFAFGVSSFGADGHVRRGNRSHA